MCLMPFTKFERIRTTGPASSTERRRGSSSWNRIRVSRGGAPEVHHRGGPAEDLLDRGWDQRRVVLEPAELSWVLDKSMHPVRDRVPGRLVAGDHEQREVVHELPLAQHALALRA